MVRANKQTRSKSTFFWCLYVVRSVDQYVEIAVLQKKSDFSHNYIGYHWAAQSAENC